MTEDILDAFHAYFRTTTYLHFAGFSPWSLPIYVTSIHTESVTWLILWIDASEERLWIWRRTWTI